MAHDQEISKTDNQWRDVRSIPGYGQLMASENAIRLELKNLPNRLTPELADRIEALIASILGRMAQ